MYYRRNASSWAHLIIAALLITTAAAACGSSSSGTSSCTSSDECASGQVCTDSSCVPTQAADAGPICDLLEPCGTTCCASDQVCIGESCVTPGSACIETLDCPIESYCDPALGRCLPASTARCEYHPTSSAFTPEQEWAWTGSTTAPDSVHVMMAPAVGDLNGDGIPEVAFNTYTATGTWLGDGVLRIVRGDTGEEIRSITTPVVCPSHGIALGDLDGDGSPEIVTLLAPCLSGQIVAFSLAGNEIWRSHNTDGSAFSANMEFGAPSIADLDGDGTAEVIVGAAVFNSDGELRWSHGADLGSNCCGPPGSTTTVQSPLTAVYDLDGNGRPEIISGNAVWRADGSVLWQDPMTADGYVAVADFGNDGTLDIVVVSLIPESTADGEVSVRSGLTGARIFGPVAIPGGGRGGPPTVADFDGDGKPEIGVAGGAAYAVFDPDGINDILWQRTTQDTSSSITGSSVFDFDGDGRAEVVYNDECYMRVYSGATGTVLAEVPQNSHTLIEYPLIVDVDADGNAEIVFAANSAVNRCDSIPDYTGLQAGIRVFRDSSDNWVGTRPVWNQHSYHITNVRKDLSIPTSEPLNATRFNNFRQNSQNFDAPNLVPSDLSADGSGCPTSLKLSAVIHNRGAVAVGTGLAISYYLGTESAPGRLLATEQTTSPIAAGSSATVVADVALMSGEQGTDQPWFVRADDIGDASASGQENECIESDNLLGSTFNCGGID